MFTEDFTHLLSPLRVGKLTIPNRLFVSPMVTNFCDDDGCATERYIAYHEEKARGGWGLIITEDYAVSRDGRGYTTAGLWRDGQIAGHGELTRRVHRHGGRIFAQIYHCGRQVHPLVPHDAPPPAPSAIPCPTVRQGARELTIPEIRTIVSQFGDCALRAKTAGFDGVEIHGAHGYLIAEFMSWHCNKRVDEYGGPLPNRLRFPLEIIADIRRRCGGDFPVTFRISADEMVRDGRVLEESLYVAHVLEKAGVDGLHVSAGVYGRRYSITPPLNIDPGWIVHLAESVKKAVGIPVFTVARIVEPGMGELILRMGRADAVVMGRNSLADPRLPEKVRQGRVEDINRCIGCIQGCQGSLRRNTGIACLVNPELGYEEKREKRPAATAKNILVAGGGIAGMQAAITARERGHAVALYEASPALGGQFALAAVPPHKGSLASFVAWQIRQLDRLGVAVHCGTKVTGALCGERKPDAVIAATGSVPLVPPIPGLEGPSVVFAHQVLRGDVVPCGEKVLVAGGGIVGAECADFLGCYGCSVTVIDKLPEIAGEEIDTRRSFLMRSLADRGTRLIPNCALQRVEGKTATWLADGKTHTESFDTIVLAMGSRADDRLVRELEDSLPVIVVGDAVAARNALAAVREGFLAGCAV